MTDALPTTGDRVRGALATARITQQEAAKALGVKQPAISKRLRGYVKFRVDELVVLADLCGVSVASLISPREEVAA